MRPARLLLSVAAALLLSAGAAPARAAEPVWTQAQLAALLATFGYTDLANLQRHGATYTADATRYGVPLRSIIIDAQTGDVLDAPSLTPAQAGAMLSAKGYTAISDVHSFSDVQGRSLSAHATDKSGHTRTWTIDPWSGAVYPATDK